MHDLYLGTDGYYVNQNIAHSPLPTLRFYRIIFCMVSSGWTTRGSSDLLQNRTHPLTRNIICFYSFHFIMQGIKLHQYEIRGIQLLFSSIYRFKVTCNSSKKSIIQWTGGLLKKRNKIEEENDIFYYLSLKYTTQAHSYKNQMFLRLKYKPA